jgi:hypothetical protein
MNLSFFDCVGSYKLIETLLNPFLEPTSFKLNDYKGSCSLKQQLAADGV